MQMGDMETLILNEPLGNSLLPIPTVLYLLSLETSSLEVLTPGNTTTIPLNWLLKLTLSLSFPHTS